MIIHLIASSFYGGPEKQIIEHLSRLNRNRYNCLLSSFVEEQANEILEQARLAGIRHHAIPMSGPWDVRAQGRLTKLLRQERVGLLCVHGYKSCVMGWWAGMRCKIPVIAFSRGYTTENKKVAFYEWLERKALRRMNGVICVSESQKAKLASYGLSPRMAWVVHNAVSVDTMPDTQDSRIRRVVYDKFRIPQNSKLVVTAGRLSPEKGHRYLVEAIAQMREHIDGTCFTFCGDGPCQKDVERQAKELGIYEQCRFPGFRRDIQDVFRAMDLLVLPSLTEGLPNVVLEAFACKKAVVATDVGGLPEIVEDGINGFLVPSRRPDLLAKAIERCLSSTQMAGDMGQAGYNKVKSEFTFESQTQELEQIYHQMLEGE